MKITGYNELVTGNCFADYYAIPQISNNYISPLLRLGPLCWRRYFDINLFISFSVLPVSGSR